MITQAKKELLIKFVNSVCEVCHKKSDKLHIHRVNRGYMGGEYILRNVMVVCNDCHKNLHYMEF